jgi:branched-chain amino acid transport system substrate-binding protein
MMKGVAVRFPFRSAACGGFIVLSVSLAACSSPGQSTGSGNSGAQANPSSAGPVITTGAADSSKSPVDILFFGSHTGLAAQYSNVVLPPEQLALQQINDHEDGINGHPLQVTLVDAQLEPAEAVQLFHQDSSTPVAMASIFSNEFAAIGPLAKAAKIPILTEATANDLISAARPYVWSVSPNITQVSTGAADQWLKAVPAIKKVVVVEDTFDATYNAQAGAVANELKAKGVDVTGIGYTQDTTNFAPLVSRIVADDPDGVVIGGTPAPGAAIVKALRQQGVKASILATQGVYTGSFSQAAGTAANGIYAYTPLYLGVPAASAFVAEYKPLAGGITPAFAAGQTYEIFEALAQALRVAHAESNAPLSEKRAAVESALTSVSVTGVAGQSVSFGSDGFARGSGSLLHQDDSGSVSVVG